jgi:short-subunit dehydrogenase
MTGPKSTALVTGASAGLGAEFCRALADRCEVIIGVARRGDRLEALARELEGRVEMHVVVADLATIEGIARTVEALRQQGPVDYLVNNAGFSTSGMFADKDIESQHAMVAVHINATLSLCRAAIPFMLERGGGRIINVSSLGGFFPGRGLAVYGASKAFLNNYSQALQLELAGSGIRVQALCPGYTHTEFHSTAELAQFDTATIPEEYWMDANAVVATSLAALSEERVLVIPGEFNQSLAQKGAQQLRDLL